MTCDPKALRSAFGRFMTGVTVVTARDADGAPIGFTANSFTSVSLNPPMLLVCPGNHLSTYDAFRQVHRFGISILAEGQETVSNLFASGKGDRFAECAWDTPAYNIPLMAGRAAGFVCDTAQVTEAGDHIILLGKVSHFDDAGKDGLGYGPGGYFSRTKERTAEAPSEIETRASVLLEFDGCLCLTDSGDLPTVSVPAGDSPLRALKAELAKVGTHADIGVVYAVYDEGRDARRLVFRARTKEPQTGLRSVPITDLGSVTAPDGALQSLLQRFAAEHKTQSFGLYYGNEHAGEILPVSGR